jgi:malonate-semialdehyde dehydrogenase (acetylating)/methylmalonate-semialdehyde dehydrogenase
VQRKVQLFIGGKFIDSTTQEWIDVHNPATQEVVARVPVATQAEMDAAIASSESAFKTWKEVAVTARVRIMLKCVPCLRPLSLRAPSASGGA